MRTSPDPGVSRSLLDRGDPDAVALADADNLVSYRELRRVVQERTEELDLRERTVVVLTGPSGVEWVVTYLALLEAGHVPLLAGDQVGRLVDAWNPGAVITTTGATGIDVDRTPHGPSADLHPDLALLMSTSGSTGSPKLVRLSHQNLLANADAIVGALGLQAHDCGITSLPLHYCYGLSVLHSHLAAGARIVTTPASVVDPCFEEAVRRHGVTSVAGVPHTFDLLEAVGPERVLGPSVRLLTQAGGRMDPAALARWRGRAAAADTELVVMYGQTEATARMAYLPPLLADACPGAVGIAVPGGALRVDPLPGRSDGVGELVYRGDNVMMGYATAPEDLATGRVLGELRTGDLGRFDADHGVFEVVGRASRFIKPYGLRIDLDAVESQLADVLGPVVATGDDERLVVAAPGQDHGVVTALVGDVCGLPASRVIVVDAPIPRTGSGKADYAAIQRSAFEQHDRTESGTAGPSVSAILAEILGRGAMDPDDTFTSAGGDSLSYIEASMRIEPLVGSLPDDWQHRPVGELDRLVPSGRGPRLDTTVVLRAAGICTVVGTHMHLAFFPGGAHLLLAVVGYNLSRFQLGLEHAGERLRAGLRTIGRVAVPTVVWAAVMFALGRSYEWTTLALVNNYLGPRGHENGVWHFWFIEAFVQLTIVVLLLFAVPGVRRVDRRFPYAFPLGLLAVTVALRSIAVAGLDDPLNLRFRTHGVAWFFVLGWLVHRSRTTAQKVLTSTLCVAAVLGFFGQPMREAFIIAGLVALTWARTIPFPHRALRAASALAGASMWILISHFQVFPELVDRLPMAAAYPATIAVGIAIWKAVEEVPRAVRRRVASSRATPGLGRAAAVGALGPDERSYASPAFSQ